MFCNIFIFIMYILNSSTTKDFICIHFKETSFTSKRVGENYFRINIIKLRFDCNKKNLLNSGCLKYVSNTSVHILDSHFNMDSIQSSAFLARHNITFENHKDENNHFMVNALNSVTDEITSKRSYIEKKIYKGGKLLVPTNIYAINHYKLSKRLIRKKEFPVQFHLMLPLNKYETLYYKYDIIQDNKNFQIVNFGVLYSFFFVCSFEDIDFKVKDAMSEFIKKSRDNVTKEMYSKLLYLVDLEVLSYYFKQIKNQKTGMSSRIKYRNVTPFLNRNKMVFDTYIGKFMVNYKGKRGLGEIQMNLLEEKNIRFDLNVDNKEVK